MRKVKFRAKRISDGKWIYGYLINPEKWRVRWISHHNDEGELTHEEVHFKTVGQLTGLIDKNGVEIYEGDILTADRYPYKDNGKRNYDLVVEWVFNSWQGIMTLVNKDKRGISDGINNELPEGESGVISFEVVGNIHDKK